MQRERLDLQGRKKSVDDYDFLSALEDLLRTASDGDDQDLAILASTALQRVQKFQGEAVEIMRHWKRRNWTYATLQADLGCIEDFILHLWYDCKEPLRFSHFYNFNF